jgi:hypothetical protein
MSVGELIDCLEVNLRSLNDDEDEYSRTLNIFFMRLWEN